MLRTDWLRLNSGIGMEFSCPEGNSICYMFIILGNDMHWVVWRPSVLVKCHFGVSFLGYVHNVLQKSVPIYVIFKKYHISTTTIAIPQRTWWLKGKKFLFQLLNAHWLCWIASYGTKWKDSITRSLMGNRQGRSKNVILETVSTPSPRPFMSLTLSNEKQGKNTCKKWYGNGKGRWIY